MVSFMIFTASVWKLLDQPMYIMRLHIIQYEINFYNKRLKCFLFLLIYLQVRIFSHKKLKIWHALPSVHMFKNMHI